MKYIVILFLLTCKLIFAQFELHKEYVFEDNTIYSTDIFPQIERFSLISITPKKMTHRLKAKKLIKIFKKHSITVTSQASVITFKRAFNFDMTPLHVRLKKYYKTHYPSMTITALHVRPKSYINALPSSYTISIPPKNYHRNYGTFYLKTSDKKKLFFEYTLEANLPVVIAKTTIQRKENISPFNTRTEIIPFKSFQSPPLSKNVLSQRWSAKIRLKEGRVLSRRDIKTTPLVKRNQNIIAVIRTEGLHVELSATAQNDGALYDMITIQKSNGEKLKAQVIGANRVEIK
ncbi:MAG: flagellar basal body P-ring formation chaperone FlgA [Campylobacterota bacterium]|nr:flagellar basal body P-ring formation chaperone FlgA [Campylobacterota bacterium]